jgi:chromosome segregation and condensation protein ScpB
MSTEISTTTTPTRGLALATFEDAFRFATMVAKSDFAPKDFKGKPESCLWRSSTAARSG